eukprot:TRINITY_DN11679_c0_g1_i1.p1 TRINITY_DN11679_c0_g1~~TRINITY_DN11679_c0_g1_i1.p1  ORF type:complete len:415 (-),score=80.31 TRINITY_DN11679_c0_g1_i1:38-1282(-)
MRLNASSSSLLVLVCLAVIVTLQVALARSVPPSQECNGVGRIYPDTTGECECFQCYSGSSCENEQSPCLVEATDGNPLLFQQFWEQNDTNGEVVIPSNYRSGYQLSSVLLDGGNLTGIQPYLKQAIVDLHAEVGNAVTDGYNIVLGSGATQLIAAVVYAYAQVTGAPVVAFAQTPYYDGYPQWAMFNPAISSWSADTNLTGAQPIVEFITTPNNPTGEVRQPYYANSYHVYDCVYYWPSLTNITVPIQGDVTLFSMSKLTGHAGTRLGWAFVKDPEVATQMGNFIMLVTISTSIDAQFRTLRLLQALNADPQQQFFNYVKQKMTYRWSQITATFAQQSRFSLESVPGQFYLWVRCLQPEDAVNCANVFQEEGNLMGLPGPLFGATSDYVRFEIVDWDAVFDILSSNLNLFLLNQ